MLWRDLAFGLRRLRRSPGFSFMVIVFLSLSIAATTAVFALVRCIVFEPLAYTESQQLVRIVGFDAAERQRDWLAMTEVDMLRSQSSSFDQLAYTTAFPATWQREEGRERLQRGFVSADYFGLLGVGALHGRLLGPGEDDRTAVVLSHDFWRRHWQADPAVIGKQLTVDDRPFTIIGVASPSTYTHDFSTAPADLWLRFSPSRPEDDADFRMFTAIGRLKPDRDLPTARTEMAGLEARLASDRPAVYGGWQLDIEPLKQTVVGAAGRPLFLLFVSLGLLLLGICANLANVVMARLLGRREEVLVHLALGGRRTAIARQLAIEGMLLSAVGGFIGLLLARWGVARLPLWLSFDLPRAAEIGLGWQAPAFTLVATVGMTLLFAWLPAVLGTRAGIAQDLSAGGRSSNARLGWLRQVMIMAQVAVALPLLIVAGLLIDSLSRLHAVDLGMQVDGLAGVRVSLPFRQYAEPALRRQFFQARLDELRAQPGVEFAAATLQMPLIVYQADRTRFKVVGQADSAEIEKPRALYQVVTAGYFETLGTRLLEGRDFTSSDHGDSHPVVIINRELQRRHFQGRSPLGQQLNIELVIEDEPRVRTIVGVIEDISQLGPAAPIEPLVFLPHAQVSWQSMTLVMRHAGPAQPILGKLRADIQRAEPAATLEPAVFPADALRDLLGPFRSASILVSCFAALGALLCLLGLYGLLSYDVQQSGRESAIRMAIGATRQSIRLRFLRRAARLVGVGTAVGLGLAWLAARMLRAAVDAVPPFDPLLFTLIPLSLMFIALLASWLPASRAVKMSLATVLRGD